VLDTPAKQLQLSSRACEQTMRAPDVRGGGSVRHKRLCVLMNSLLGRDGQSTMNDRQDAWSGG
jgi:hypothetical protein